jgi:predicted transcriptional regulator
MKKVAYIRIERDWRRALERGGQEFARAWKTGKQRGSHLSFESPAALFKAITPARWAVLETLQRLGPSGLRALARALARDVKAVHRDVHALIGLGLIEKDDDGRLRVPFARIRTEFDLATLSNAA